MWNVFDFSFIIIFLAYLGFRIKGLIHGDGSFSSISTSQRVTTCFLAASSKMGFDLLACGACILIPRLAFFAVSNNVVVLYDSTLNPVITS
jgi:hypothetical protein